MSWLQNIGFGHVLTPAELSSGKLVIGGHPVDYRSGITRAQATQLLDSDLEPYRRQVRQLVGAKLTHGQPAQRADVIRLQRRRL